MKRSFFQAAVVSILLYGCTTWTLNKRLMKKLDGNYTRMLRAILNKSWQQHPTRHQLYGHLPPITKTTQVRRTRHAGHYWRSKDELISDVLLWTPAYDQAKAGRPARTYIQQLCEDTGCNLKTCQKRWKIGRSGERGSGISVLASTTWWWWFLLYTGRATTKLMYKNINCFFSFLFIFQNVRMSGVNVSRRWLKCTHAGATVRFFSETSLPFCFVLPGSKFFPVLYNFPETHAILVITPSANALHMDMPPV